MRNPEGLRNEDALLLQQAMSLDLGYEQVNPVALKPAVAPHIAAQQAGKRLIVSQLAGYCRGVLMQRADIALIEGAGGWQVPLNSVETMAKLGQGIKSAGHFSGECKTGLYKPCLINR